MIIWFIHSGSSDITSSRAKKSLFIAIKIKLTRSVLCYIVIIVSVTAKWQRKNAPKWALCYTPAGDLLIVMNFIATSFGRPQNVHRYLRMAAMRPGNSATNRQSSATVLRLPRNHRRRIDDTTRCRGNHRNVLVRRSLDVHFTFASTVPMNE